MQNAPTSWLGMLCSLHPRAAGVPELSAATTYALLVLASASSHVAESIEGIE
jgi:hypothetical protein